MASSQASAAATFEESASGTLDNTSTPRETTLKRRRVARACQNCRLQKSKCDGRHPVCNRCEGYGHTCVWSDEKPVRSQEVDVERGRASSSTVEPTPSSASLSKAIAHYEKLIRSIRVKLSNPDRTVVDLTISYIRRHLPEEIQRLVTLNGPRESDSTSPQSFNLAEPEERNVEGQRYVGQASDVWFFHSIKEIFQNDEELETALGNVMQSYDGKSPRLKQGVAPELPTRDLANSYVDIYFSTIHIAYPFISKAVFMERFEKFWSDGLTGSPDEDSWLSLLYTLFAIGAYYTSFPRSENAETLTHLQYFEQALSCGDSIMTDCTLANVQTLVAQCFFLLATGQTDRCWNTLGLAIRVGQSIGLHVEDSLKRPKTSAGVEKQETMRRTWYSMYVLDRLLALQLGRPAAIHENDYCVNLPSRTGESVSTDDHQQGLYINPEHSSLDYFLSVIKFSWILGRVINDLYSPSQVVEADYEEMLLKTTSLDLLLSEWKRNLPRHLRFDLGHTFERSVVFRRQRNMLAIKFHHLRALIHRPYLCLTWLQRHNHPLMALLELAHDRVEYFEGICVAEAQEIAHRLNNVSDERSLVYDFPWWQMISCLLCASSILLVASACINPAEVIAELQSQMLNEDAETCLKVFDALSVNSDAARRARDMMKGLKRTRIITRNQAHLEKENSSLTPGPFGHVLNLPMTSTLLQERQHQSSEFNVESDSSSWQGWPGELSDAMEWSAQFLDPAQPLSFEDGRSSALEMPQFLPTENNLHSSSST